MKNYKIQQTCENCQHCITDRFDYDMGIEYFCNVLKDRPFPMLFMTSKEKQMYEKRMDLWTHHHSVRCNGCCNLYANNMKIYKEMIS
jgi:hypothetical protein